MLRRANDAAANFGPGVPGRLRCEIIRHTVDDDCAADDIRYLKAIGQNNQKRPPLAFKQRRQITCMLWMRALSGIIMAFRIRKVRTCTRGSLVNMKAEHAGGAGCAAMRQAAYLGGNDDAQRDAEKRNRSRESGRTRSTGNAGNGSRMAQP